MRVLNDQLRQHGIGGTVVITPGVRALGPGLLLLIKEAVTSFDAFDADNHPCGEHDCGVLTVGVERVIWKIDCYDWSLSGHSPDPADPAVTTRFLTIMLAEEY